MNNESNNNDDEGNRGHPACKQDLDYMITIDLANAFYEEGRFCIEELATFMESQKERLSQVIFMDVQAPDKRISVETMALAGELVKEHLPNLMYLTLHVPSDKDLQLRLTELLVPAYFPKVETLTLVAPGMALEFVLETRNLCSMICSLPNLQSLSIYQYPEEEERSGSAFGQATSPQLDQLLDCLVMAPKLRRLEFYGNWVMDLKTGFLPLLAVLNSKEIELVHCNLLSRQYKEHELDNNRRRLLDDTEEEPFRQRTQNVHRIVQEESGLLALYVALRTSNCATLLKRVGPKILDILLPEKAKESHDLASRDDNLLDALFSEEDIPLWMEALDVIAAGANQQRWEALHMWVRLFLPQNAQHLATV